MVDSLQPWDMMRLYRTPVESHIIGNGTQQQLVAADSSRKILTFALTIGTGFILFTRQDATNPNSFGVQLQATGQYMSVLTMTWDTWGPLVAATWFGYGAAGDKLTVWECFSTDPVPMKKIYVPTAPVKLIDYRWPKNRITK